MRFTQGEYDVAIAAARKAINETGYGNWVSDDKLAQVVDEVLKAIEGYKSK